MRKLKELTDAMRGVDLSKNAIKNFYKKYNGKKLIAEFEMVQGEGKKNFDRLYVFVRCPGIGGLKGFDTMSKDPYYDAFHALIEIKCSGDEVNTSNVNLVLYTDTLFVYNLPIREYEFFVKFLLTKGIEIKCDSISSKEIDENDSDYASEASDLVKHFSDNGLKALGFTPNKIRALAKKYEEEQEKDEE